MMSYMNGVQCNDVVFLPDLFQSWQPLHLRTIEVSGVPLYLDQALEELLLAWPPFWSWRGYLEMQRQSTGEHEAYIINENDSGTHIVTLLLGI